jgi:hypothetical protein
VPGDAAPFCLPNRPVKQRSKNSDISWPRRMGSAIASTPATIAASIEMAEPEPRNAHGRGELEVAHAESASHVHQQQEP